MERIRQKQIPKGYSKNTYKVANQILNSNLRLYESEALRLQKITGQQMRSAAEFENKERSTSSIGKVAQSPFIVSEAQL